MLRAAGCLVDLWSAIWSRTHRHVTGAGEGSTTCWACHHVLHNWKVDERLLMSDVVGDMKNKKHLHPPGRPMGDGGMNPKGIIAF